MKVYVYRDSRSIYDLQEIETPENNDELDEYIVDIPEDLVQCHKAILASLIEIEDKIYEYEEKHIEQVRKAKLKEYNSRVSGLTSQEIREECEKRLNALQEQYPAHELTNCSACIPGMRHIVGDCVLCGCGPAPVRMPNHPEPLLIHEINAAFAN